MNHKLKTSCHDPSAAHPSDQALKVSVWQSPLPVFAMK